MFDKFLCKFTNMLHKTQKSFSLRRAVLLVIPALFAKLFLFPNSVSWVEVILHVGINDPIIKEIESFTNPFSSNLSTINMNIFSQA